MRSGHSSRCLAVAALVSALPGAAPRADAQFSVRGPLDNNIVGYYFDHQPGPGALDWRCQTGGPLGAGQAGRAYDGHRGSDFWAYRNAPVYAAACGRVTFIQDGFPDGYLGNTDGAGFGNQVWIDHGGGAVTIYGHLQAGSLSVQAGDTVAAGTRIGGMGTSGNSSGLHLHFEIRQDGLPVDPFFTPGGCNTTVSASLWTAQNWDRPGTLAPPCAQAPTDPTAQGSCLPARPTAGELVRLVVSVVPGLNPTSSGLSVTADARPIGGLPALTLLDTGVAGGCDDVAGDNVFVACTTVDLYTAPGPKSLSATIRDAQGRSAAALIAIDVRPAPDADGDALPDLWESLFGLNPSSDSGADGPAGDPDGDGKSNLAEYAAGTHPRGFFSRYFAEGATGNFFDLSLALLNVSPTTPASTLLRFQKGDGTSAWYPLNVPAHTRRTVNAELVPGLTTAEFSTVIESDSPLIADRTMSWDATGYGSHAETSLPSPETTWYLAEGATHSGFNLFYLIQNPNSQAATVEVTYLLPAPRAPINRTYGVGANTRFNIWVDSEGPELQSTDVSATITADVPIIVERAMYLDQPGKLFGAGHESAGVTTPATEWFLAEGNTGNYFDLFVLIANPGDVPASITATFLLPDGSSVVKGDIVQPKSRSNIWVDTVDERLRDTAVSTIITSTNDVPIIVERAMWWPGPTAATWAEAHNSAGLTATGRTFALADGEVGGSRGTETYILIANRGTAETARVTLYYEDGTTEQRLFALPASSRTNVAVGFDFPNSKDRRFGAVVEALGPDPQIAVERAMYSNAGGVTWAAGTNAVATKLQ